MNTQDKNFLNFIDEQIAETEDYIALEAAKVKANAEWIKQMLRNELE